MLNKDSTSYIFLFALIVCVVCAFLLALVSEGLRSKRELNQEIDIMKNILKVVELREPIPERANTLTIKKIYEQYIDEIVIDAHGNIIEGKSPLDIIEGDGLLPLYVYKEDGVDIAYAFPIVGKGLWSTLYGYFSLEPDAVTVRGITFYQHGETPGLGAEIEKEWFQSNFEGKKIWDIQKSTLEPVQVIKGKVVDKISEGEQQYYVDGISGATITSRGVSEMVDRELRKYEPFFKKIRKNFK